MDVVKLLTELVNIRSDKRISNKNIICYISSLFKDYETRIISHIKNNLELNNLIVKIPAKNNSDLKPIVFAMHTDTVVGDWFVKPIETDEEIIGLGSCDMKGGIAAVCSCVLNNRFDRDIILLFSSDEESGGTGSKLILDSLELQDSIVIIPEPTSKKIFTNQNSCVGFRVWTTGIQNHSSLTSYPNNQSNNAIYKMIEISNYLINLEKNNPMMVQNIGFINGGITGNQIPDKCFMKFEQRFRPNIDLPDVVPDLVDKVYSLGAKYVEISFFGNGFENTNEILKLKFNEILRKHMDSQFGKFPAWSEAGIYKVLGDCFIFGPGNLEDAHMINESVKKIDLIQFESIYSDLIKNL